LYLGLAVPMAASFVGGIGLPILLRGGGDPSQRGTLLTLLIAGVLLTFVFTAIAFAIALWADDRLRALGAARVEELSGVVEHIVFPMPRGLHGSGASRAPEVGPTR
jgi:hypothetical protein